VSLTCTTYHFSSFCKRLILFILIFSFCINGIAQNLFANAGFEEINVCTEYRATCAPEAWYYIKPTTNPLVNGRAAPRPLLGTNILLVPVHNVFDPKGTRPYVYTMLACPLATGEKYKLSFYINTSGRKFYNLDFYFSDKEPATIYFNTTNISPAFSITTNEIVGELKQGWQAVEYYFTATGNERFCMLGNLSQPMDYEIKEKMNSSGTVFYFLDDIKLSALNNIPLCEEYAHNIKMMYALDSRHTDHTLIAVEIIKPKPPVFITDTISIPAVFFETNSARLKQSFHKIMDSIAVTLSAKAISKIDINGHTDNKGKQEDNMLLSLNRAQAVKNYLVNKLPQYANNTFIAGKGQDQPIADNETEQGRTRNRRVEIILTIIEQQK
jgi:outer membrane protein OmpA-like peptidoglycan-associated protein